MATKPFRIQLGGAQGWLGVQQALDPRRADPRSLSFADRVNFLEGDLRGFVLPGATGGSASRGPAVIAIPDATGGTVVSGSRQMSQCVGPINPASTNDQLFSWHAERGAGVTWCDGYGGTSTFLGFPKPVITGAVNGASGGARRFRVTYRVQAVGLDRKTFGDRKSDYYNYPAVYESNPSTYATFVPGAGVTLSTTTSSPIGYVELANYVGGTLTIAPPPVAATANLAGMTWEAAVYATPPGNTSGPYLFCDRVTGILPAGATTTAFAAPSAATYDSNLILSWDDYGSPGNQLFVNDNSPAPHDPATYTSTIEILSDGFHTVADTTGSGAAGALPVPGILFAATATELRWSRVGYPWCWPLANSVPIRNIQAIVNNGPTTYVGTTLGWYVVTGTDDQNLSIAGPFANDGIAEGAGRSAVLTPRGVLYLGRRGLCVFDGNTSTLLHEITTHPANEWGGAGRNYWPSSLTATGYTGFACLFGLFFDNLYISDLGAGSRIIAALDDWPVVKVTYANSDNTRPGLATAYLAQDSRQTQTATLVSEVPPAPMASLDVAITGAGSLNMSMWSPRRGVASPNTNGYMYWQAVSQRIDLGEPGQRKKLKRVSVRGDGAFSITVRAGRGISSVVAAFTTTTSGLQWLPATMDWVDWVQVEITSGDVNTGTGGTGVVESVDIEGVVYEHL